MIPVDITDERRCCNNNEEGEPLILGFIYGWNANTQNYMLSDTLDPGYGYWMYAYYNCTLLQSEA